jgi:hypothetical protein
MKVDRAIDVFWEAVNRSNQGEMSPETENLAAGKFSSNSKGKKVGKSSAITAPTQNKSSFGIQCVLRCLIVTAWS